MRGKVVLFLCCTDRPALLALEVEEAAHYSSVWRRIISARHITILFYRSLLLLPVYLALDVPNIAFGLRQRDFAAYNPSRESCRGDWMSRQPTNLVIVSSCCSLPLTSPVPHTISLALFLRTSPHCLTRCRFQHTFHSLTLSWPTFNTTASQQTWSHLHSLSAQPALALITSSTM
jgi:hypothetical protein